MNTKKILSRNFKSKMYKNYYKNKFKNEIQ